MTGRDLVVDPTRPELWLGEVGEPGLELLAVDQPQRGERARGARCAISAVDARVAAVEGGDLVELTPFGLVARGLGGDERRLDLLLAGFGRRTVAVRGAGNEGDAYRFDLREVDAELQRAVHRLSRHLRTVDLVAGVCRGEGAAGWVPEPDPLRRLRTGGADWVTVVAGRLVDGRAPRGDACWDDAGLLLHRPLEGVDGEAVDVLCTSGSVTVAGTVSIDELRVRFRKVAQLADRRRGRVRLATPAPAELDGAPVRIVDVSGQGFGLHVDARNGAATDGIVDLCCGDHHWSVTVRHAHGCRAGVRVVPSGLTWRGVAIEDLGELPATDVGGLPPRSTVVDLGVGAQRVATRVTSVDGEGAPIGVVLTSGWGQTKESTGVVATVLASVLGATGRPVEVVRFDYRNTRGGSWIEPKHAVPGRESLGFRAGDAVDDLAAVVESLATRLGAEATIVLVGISFSGPFALRVAGDDQRVSGVIQMMAATDLQDLIRRSTGGIDVVAELERGAPTGHLDILGVLLDTQVAIGDAVANRLATFVHSEDLVHRCDVPLRWLVGASDRFVDPERVRLLCASASDASIVELPGGHVPTSSEEVLACVWPMARSISTWAGCPLDRIVVPDDSRVLELWEEELADAPRLAMPHPEDYWRGYLLGDTGLSGYEILALTEEYRQLMADQVRLANLPPGGLLVDLGSGLGTLLDHLPPFDRPPEVLLCDLASEALGAGAARRRRDDVLIRLARWDGDLDPLPAEVDEADVVLASLFLSALDDASALVGQLADRMRPGARLVVSSVLPDADLSVIVEQVLGDPARAIAALPTTMTVDELVHAVRSYVSSAADLMRRAELGEIRLYTRAELERLLAVAGFDVIEARGTMGSPPRAAVVCGTRPVVPDVWAS